MQFFEVYSEVGAGKSGANHGVQMLARHCQSRYPNAKTCKVYNRHKASCRYDKAKFIENLTPFFADELAPRLKAQLAQGEKTGRFTVALSGDHANALGNVSAFLDFHRDKKIAVVWIDAHADMHSVYTTPSGNLHGMPLAAAMGLDNQECAINAVDDTLRGYWQRLKSLHQNAYGLPQDAVFFLGLRSFEAPEAYLLQRGSTFARSALDHRQEGILPVLDKLAKRLADFDLLYISFDVDALDSSLIAATGTPEPLGYYQEEMKIILNYMLKLPNAGFFEVTEFNPTLDDDSDKRDVIFALLDEALETIAQRQMRGV